MTPIRSGLGWAAVGIGLAMAGCGQGNVYREPPPPEVVVATPVRRPVTSYLEQTGTAQASERVELRARVRGFLKERLFRDGDRVEAGKLLFVIDEVPFQVRLDQTRAKEAEAEALLRKAETSKAREVSEAALDLAGATLELARAEEARTRSLVSRNAGSREDLDRNESTRKRAEAQIESDRANRDQAKTDYEINILSARSSLAAARADVRNAEIDLGYCRIKAPIPGRINAREFDVGNYVGDGQSTVLAAIVKADPIYAYITPGEDDLLRVRRIALGAGVKDYRDATIAMEMGLGDEAGYPHPGRLDYADPSIDTGTGTIRVRGVFPNPDEAITPGLFVRVRLAYDRRDDALLVPDRALGADQGGAFLLVVGEGDKVERRTVTTGQGVGGMRVVDGNIHPGDRVVVDGLLRARPGLKVVPKAEAPAEIDAQAKAAAVAAAKP